LGEGGLELWSVYNPRWNLGDPLGKSPLPGLLQRPRPTGQVILSGDFNLYYPLWDQYDRYNRRVETLLELALQWDLDLRTPKGAVTRAP
jgi:hypothetical protein